MNVQKNSIGSSAYNFLSSKQLNVFLSLAVAAYAVLLVVWAVTSPGDIVYNIGTSLPFKLVLVFFTLNNFFCLAKQIPLSLRSCRVDRAPSVAKIRQADHLISSAPLEGWEERMMRAGKLLRRSGYKVVYTRDRRGIGAVRGRWAPLGTLLFHFSLFALVAGVALGALTQSNGSAVLAEGETFAGSRDEYATFAPKDRFSDQARISFEVEKIKPRFWGRRLLFTDLYARIRFPAGTPTGTKDVRLNSNWKPNLFTYVSLTNIGYAPLYEIRDGSGKLLDSGFVKLVTFPPGTEDSFATELGNLDVKLKIYPDYVKKGGKITTKSMNLSNPLIQAEAGTGGRVLFDGALLPGEIAPLGGGFTLAFPEIRYWGEFRIITNRGLPVLWIGFLLGSIAVAWRLFFYQRQVSAIVDHDGRLLLRMRFDYQQNINEMRIGVRIQDIFKTQLARERP